MKALLVIDVQDIYLKKYQDTSFIEKINERISEARRAGWLIIYIQNTGLLKSNGEKYAFCARLQIVSDSIFRKYVPDAFSNTELLKYLKDNNVDEIELVGIDGAICVYHTAKGAITHNFITSIRSSCVATGTSKEKYQKMQDKLIGQGVKFIE